MKKSEDFPYICHKLGGKFDSNDTNDGKNMFCHLKNMELHYMEQNDVSMLALKSDETTMAIVSPHFIYNNVKDGVDISSDEIHVFLSRDEHLDIMGEKVHHHFITLSRYHYLVDKAGKLLE